MNGLGYGNARSPRTDAFQRRRRWQYSLKGLFVATLAAGLMLGAWNVVADFGQFIDGAPVKVGNTIHVQGRLIQLFGPRERRYSVYLQRAPGWTVHVEDGRARRCWLCAYPIDIQIAWPLEAGTYGLILRDPDSAERTLVCGSVIVSPSGAHDEL